MTREEAILLSAYTQYLLVPDFSEVHKFCEATLGRPILTHEFASKSIWKELRDALRPQIESLIHNISALRPVSREQVEKFKEYFDNLYGKGLEVYGWHMNGEAKSFDDFYEDACEYAGL